MEPPLPSVVTLSELRHRYDALVLHLSAEDDGGNNSADDDDDAARWTTLTELELVCEIVLAIATLPAHEIANQQQTATLQRTVRRCRLLRHVLEHPHSHHNDMTTESTNNNDGHNNKPNLHVESVHSQDGMYQWRLVVDTIDLANVDLAAEEQNLLRMARTPCPDESAAATIDAHGMHAVRNDEHDNWTAVAAAIRDEWQQIHSPPSTA